jgi:DNA-binding transcriptional regulator YdaS (Cro superfamily)
MTQRDEAVQMAIETAGGIRALARAVGVSSPSIMAWTRIPAHRILQVEMLTGIPREKLRPDLYRKRRQRRREQQVQQVYDDFIQQLAALGGHHSNIAVEAFHLMPRTTGSLAETIQSRRLLGQLAEQPPTSTEE